MVKLFKTLINNGFVVLGLLIVVTLYLAYSQKPQPMEKPTAHTAAESTQKAEATATPTAPDTSSVSITQTAAAAETDTPPVVAEAESSAPAETQPAEPVAANTPKPTGSGTQPDTTPAPAAPADAEAPAPIPEAATAPAQAVAPTPKANETEKATKTETDSKPEPTTLANGLLFDPAKVPPQAILSHFPNLQAALAEAERARAEGDLNWAAAIYAALLHYYPRSDIAGTLGNLFWQLGDKTWAHRAWRYAAQLLIKEGRLDIAAQFADNIEKLDPALSQEIRAHLPKAAQPIQPDEKAN